MGTNYDRLFKVLSHDSIPTYLCERICEAIVRERERSTLLRERTRFITSSLSGISSLVGLMFALPALLRAADVSGFSTFAGLFMTDGDVLATHLNTFALSLVEAFPGFEVTVTLFLVAVFLVSLHNFVRSISSTPLFFTHTA